MQSAGIGRARTPTRAPRAILQLEAKEVCLASSKEDVTKRYVADMIALERYAKQAAESQLEKGRFAGHQEASEVVRSLRTTTSDHLDRLGEELARLGGEPTKTIKETVAGAAGSVVDMLQRLRSEQESKMLRDHYATLSLMRMGYIALHTTGLALNQPQISGMALRHWQT